MVHVPTGEVLALRIVTGSFIVIITDYTSVLFCFL